MVYITIKKKSSETIIDSTLSLIIPSMIADPTQDPEPKNLTVTAISYSLK